MGGINPYIEAGETQLPAKLYRITFVCEGEETVVEVDPELVSEVARVFVRWPRLRREEKRDLLLAYRIQAFISRPERGVLQIEHIDIGAAGFPSGVRIFKERHPSDGKP